MREGKYPVFTNRRRVQEESSPLVAVLADAFNARFEDQHFATKAVTDVIAQTEGPARWGVYSLDGRGLLILHDYSEDSWSHIERLAVRASGGSLGALTPDESEAQPAKGGRNEPAAGEFRVRVATTLSAFRGIGQHRAALPGRKSLIRLTAGLSLSGIVGGVTELDPWYRTLDTLNDANVAVYTIDSAGVRTIAGFLAGQATGRGIQRAISGRVSRDTDITRAISESTGGRSFSNGRFQSTRFAQVPVGA